MISPSWFLNKSIFIGFQLTAQSTMKCLLCKILSHKQKKVKDARKEVLNILLIVFLIQFVVDPSIIHQKQIIQS